MNNQREDATGNAISQHFARFIDTIIDTTGIGLWDWDLKTGRVIYSRQWEIIAGYEPGTLAQTVASWENALLPEDLAHAENEINRHLAGITPRYEAEFRMVRPGGEIIWAQDKGIVTEWDDEGNPARLIGVLQEITRIKKTEEALKQQTEQLDFVAGMSGLGRWDWDIPGERIQYDTYYLQMIGYDASEVDGSFAEWETFVHPDDLARVSQALDDYVAGRSKAYSTEARMRHKDGHYIWTLDTGRVVEWDEAGNPKRLLGGHLDIDRIKRAELNLQEEVDKAVRDLQETQQFSDAMFDANPYINIILDDELRLMDCNPAAVEYFGFSSKEDLLKNLLPLLNKSIPAFQPDGSPSTPLASRFAYVIDHGFIEFEVELVLRDKRVPMRFTLKKIAHKESFAIAGYLVDMLSLREARNELLRQDYLLRQVNRAATRMMAASPENFDSAINKVIKSLGRSVNASRMHIWENFEQDGKVFAREAYLWEGEARITDISAGGAAFAYADFPEWFAQMSAKKVVNQLVSALPEHIRKTLPRNTKVIMLIPIYFAEQFWGVVALDKTMDDSLFTNIEEKVIQSGGILIVSAIARNHDTQSLIVAREAALASDKAKSEFLSRMSHEIRTPMNAIIGMTAIAKKTHDLPRIQYSLDKIEAASAQLLDIINDILDMSKIESGKFEITPVSFNLEKMMENVFNVVQVRIDEKKQVFSFDFESLFEREVLCDELRLSQVLINLITNAVKFTPEEGDISLKVRYLPKHDDIFTLHVEVKDTGIGLSREQQGRLFRSFEQADGSITRRFGGTGLGLAICKSITTLMGGDIWVQSEEGHGSTFIFEVEFTWGEPITDGAARTTLRHGLTLLIADDSEETRLSFQNILKGYGLTFDLAATGDEAAERAAAAQRAGKPYDVVFLDWKMPGMPTGEVAEAVRGALPDAAIVMMSSSADWPEIEPAVRGAGITDFMPKPVLPSTLYNLLVRLTATGGKQPDKAAPPPAANEIYSWPDKHVLVVEDVEINREIIGTILEETRLSIDFAENGRLGVDAFKANPEKYDLILMDIQMPELDGLGATREIRALDMPRAKNIPIIAMTANAFTEDVERCLAAGMNDHIPKPIDVDAMMKKLSEYLDTPIETN